MQKSIHGPDAMKDSVRPFSPDEPMIEMSINGRRHRVPESATILEACRMHGYFVPTICRHPRLKPLGRCQACAVENLGTGYLTVSCSTRVTSGMRISTDSAKARAQQSRAIEDLKIRQQVARPDVLAHQMTEWESIEKWAESATLMSNGAIRIDPTQCVRCGRCVAACGQLQEMRILEMGASSAAAPVGGLKLQALPCIGCGQCVSFCPTQAIACEDHIEKLSQTGIRARASAAISHHGGGSHSQHRSAHQSEGRDGAGSGADPHHPGGIHGLPVAETGGAGGDHHHLPHQQHNRHGHYRAGKKVYIVQTAPSVRVALGEAFGMAPGTLSTGKMVAALHAIGFDYVLDTTFGADLTIMEEAAEFINRLTGYIKGDSSSVLPMFTSCCPAWVNLIEQEYPQFIPNLSTCRSPMSMVSAIIRTYFAKTIHVRPEDIVTCAVMPCTAKKMEASRRALTIKESGKSRDTEIVLTTVELAEFIRMSKLDWARLPEEDFDTPLGKSSGAGAMFGMTGGVMEASLRTAYEWATERKMPRVEFNRTGIHGFEGLKRATITLPLKQGPRDLNIAVCSGISSARQLLEAMIKGEVQSDEYQFIEVMACPGGCIGGGGQPASLDAQILEKRAASVISIDEASSFRRSHENPDIILLYEEFLTRPGSSTAHRLLHTKYNDRSSLFTRPDAIEDQDTAVTLSSEGLPISFIYATQTGQSHRLAMRLYSDSQSKNIPIAAQLKAVCKVTMDWFMIQKRIVYITSTFGMGEHPEKALPFIHTLQKLPPNSLKDMEYAIFGLGSSAYPLYCKAAEDIDSIFKRLGARPFLELDRGDEQAPEGHESSFTSWTERLWDTMGVSDLISTVAPRPKHLVMIGSRMMNPPPTPINYEYLEVINTELLTSLTSDHSCMKVRFNIKSTNFRYETGAHLILLPRNNPTQILGFMDRMGYNPDMVLICQCKDSGSGSGGSGGSGGGTPIPGVTDGTPLTIREILEQYLAMTGRINRSFLKKMIPFAGYEDRKRLMYLTSKEGNDEYLTEFTHESITYIEAFDKFPSVKPTFEYLLDMIPPQSHRMYSVASSRLLNPDQLDIMIVIVSWNSQGGKYCIGQTSDFVKNWMQPGTLILGSIQKSPLTPPIDPLIPLTFIAMGVGISPFRAIFQHRQALYQKGVQMGPCTLYFGCRRRDEDSLCMDELLNWEQMGILTVNWAFSRESDDKIYVTHRIQENGDQIKRDLGERDGILGYCGGAGSATKSVENEVKKHFKDMGLDANARWDELYEKNMILLEAY